MERHEYRLNRAYRIRQLKAVRAALRGIKRSRHPLTEHEAEAFRFMLERHRNYLVHIRHQYYGEGTWPFPIIIVGIL